jgi:hypothetical protein
VAAVFGLVVGFPLRDPGLDRARATVEEQAVVQVRGVDVPVGLVVADMEDAGHTRLSVGVAGIAPPVWPQDWDSEATACDLRDTAAQLYELLRSFDGYLLARVGLLVEESVDPGVVGERLREDGLWKLEGIVVADALADGWGIEALLEPFAPGYRWHPYEP